MPNIYADDFNTKRNAGGQDPKGWTESYPWAKVANIADKLYFGIIPGGVEVSSLELVNDALTSGTLSLGYEPVDGVSPAANLTYFLTTAALGTAGRIVSLAQPLLFNKPVRLVGTLAGAATLVTTKLTPVVAGTGRGIA
jgi:hypothetical protein